MEASFEEALAFVKTLKRNVPNFESFAQALTNFRKGNIDSADLVSNVSEFLHGRPDLLAGFNNFLPENHKLSLATTSQSHLSLKRRKEVVKEGVEFVNKVRKVLKDDDVYTSFLRVVTDFQAHRNVVRVDKEISALFNDNPELYIDFTWFTADTWPDKCPDQDVGVSFTRKAAKKASARTKTLEKCEDELYESDVRFHGLESAEKATEKLLNEMWEKSNGCGGIKVEDYYSAMNLKCIKKMYGEDGEEMMKHLLTNPMLVLGDLLCQLNENLEEAKKQHNKVKQRCAETMRNYYRET